MLYDVTDHYAFRITGQHAIYGSLCCWSVWPARHQLYPVHTQETVHRDSSVTRLGRVSAVISAVERETICAGAKVNVRVSFDI